MSRWWLVTAFILAGCQGAGPEPVPRIDRPPLVEVEQPDEYVGFDAEVRVRARVHDIEGDRVRLRWEQLSGPPVEIADPTSATLAFRTHRLDELAPREDGDIRFLPLDRHGAGHYRFRLTASDEGGRTEAEVLVKAGAMHPGWPRASMGVESVLDLGREQERYDWEVSFFPPRTDPQLLGADTRRPRLKLSRPGRYEVREKVSGRKLPLHSGPWLGNERGGCGRVECHPLEQRGWELTKMGTIFQRGVDGLLRDDYGTECLRCHTVGWNPAVDNGGFDDIARRYGWTVPDRLEPGNYASLPEEMIERSNVGCEACHGPGRFYTSYSAEVCAQCHDELPRYVHSTEWRRSVMATATEREGILGRGECERCHTAQGFLDEYYGHQPVEATAREEDAQYEAEPITCATCHDAHGGTVERLVRLSGPLAGQEPDVDWGTGMICLACHHGGTQWINERGALMRPFVPRFREFPESIEVTIWDRRLAPHAPQGDLLRGRGGFALPGPGPLDARPPHITVPGGCLGCHVRVRPPEDDPRRLVVGGHTFAMFHGEDEARVENTLACEPCHGPLDSLSRPVRADYDGNGRIEGIFEEIDGLLRRARRALDGAIRREGFTNGDQRAVSFGEYDGRIVLVDEAGEPLRGADHPMTFSRDRDQEGLYRLVYNYMLVDKDRSRGVHNPVWAVRLLQRTVLRLAPRDVPDWDWR